MKPGDLVQIYRVNGAPNEAPLIGFYLGPSKQFTVNQCYQDRFVLSTGIIKDIDRLVWNFKVIR